MTTRNSLKRKRFFEISFEKIETIRLQKHSESTDLVLEGREDTPADGEMVLNEEISCNDAVEMAE